MSYSAIFLLLLTGVKISASQESAQYLRNVIRELKQMKDKSNGRRIVQPENVVEIVSTTSTPFINRRVHEEEIPPLSLTKDELASLYENAVSKGNTVQLDTGDETYVNAAIHELDDDNGHSHDQHQESDEHEASQGDETGYYYYYYPIKSFLDEITSQPSDKHKIKHGLKPHSLINPVKPNHNYNYHRHTHQHNVKITKSTLDGNKKNKLEPLFMAISGFLGMAVMFVLSVLVFPKFGFKPHKPKGKNDLGDIARIALQAIEGQDCRERFACELSKTARSLNLQENRFVRLFWKVAPNSISKKFASIYKYNNKQMKCTAIPCKKQVAVKVTPKPNKKKTKKS